jgi:peptidoglycan/xylan/chitin deacetylase (PgdA/CDA1 family)
MKNKILICFMVLMLALSANVQIYAQENTNINESEINTNRNIDLNKPMVALTFDDGPSEQYTPAILDVLEKNNSAATFFILGTEIENNEDILVRMVEGGNQIGNHSYNHNNLTTLSNKDLNEEMSLTDKKINEATKYYTPSIMRPPFGFVNNEFNKKIYKPIVLWSLDTKDWENRNTEIIVNKILDNVKDGDIILMHDIYDSTAKAVEIVVPELINRGYQLVTVSELYEYKNSTTLFNGEVYNKLLTK